MTLTHLSCTGKFNTDKASKYLQQLCKHFSHKIDVRFDDTSGEVALPPGPARLTATDSALLVTIDAQDNDSLDKAKGVIDSHLARFAFRENFTAMDWSA